MGRMLGAVTKGKQSAPLRELVYGVEGVGKTTFGAEAPNPIFVGEDGTKRLDVSRFPVIRSWPDLLVAVQELTVEKHPYESVVFDTLDHLEQVLFAHICEVADEPSIESVGGGYGKGYTRAGELWRDILTKVTELQEKRGTNVIFLAHATSEKYSPPMGEEYDRFSLKLHKKSAQLIKGWAESVLFAAYEDTVKKGRGFGSKKAGDAFSRVLYCTRIPAADAKNRYGLPGKINLSFEDFWRLIHREEAERSAELRAQCETLIAELAETVKRDAATKALAGAKTLQELQRVLSRILKTVEAQEEASNDSNAGGGEASPSTPPESGSVPPVAAASTAAYSPSPATSTPGAQAAGPGPLAAPATTTESTTRGASPQAGGGTAAPGAGAPAGAAPTPCLADETPSPEDDEAELRGPIVIPSREAVLAVIGAGQGAHYEKVVHACARPDEPAEVSLAIGNLLEGLHGGDRVCAWWNTAMDGAASIVRPEGKKAIYRRSPLSARGLVGLLARLAPAGARS